MDFWFAIPVAPLHIAIRIEEPLPDCACHETRLARIFQTLQRDPKERSTGICVSIVQKVVGMNEAEIEVESASDRGTAFGFSLPGAV